MGMQDAFTACERCRVPVIASIHGACVGAGIDLATACDIRCCTERAVFCVKEIDLGGWVGRGSGRMQPTDPPALIACLGSTLVSIVLRPSVALALHLQASLQTWARCSGSFG